MDLDLRNAPAKNWLALRRVPCDGFCPKRTICCKDTACRQLERLQRPGAYLQSGETTQNGGSCPIGRGLCETSTSSSVHSRRRGGEKASRHFILRGTATPDSHARAGILACRLGTESGVRRAWFKFSMWRFKFLLRGFPPPVLLQGTSRHLIHVLDVALQISAHYATRIFLFSRT